MYKIVLERYMDAEGREVGNQALLPLASKELAIKGAKELAKNSPGRKVYLYAVVETLVDVYSVPVVQQTKLKGETNGSN